MLDGGCLVIVAEGAGFEPAFPQGGGTKVFETWPLNHSGTLPKDIVSKNFKKIE